MFKAPSDLPNDLAALRAMIALRDAEIKAQGKKL